MFQGKKGAFLLCLIGFGIIFYVAVDQGYIKVSMPSSKNDLVKTEDKIEELLKKRQLEAAQKCLACQGTAVVSYKMQGKEFKQDCPYCTPSKKQKKQFVTSASDLSLEYAKDPEKTRKKYQGSRLILTGQIKGVGSIISGSETRFWCTLEGKETTALNCQLLPNFHVIKESKGKLVTIVGFFPEEQKNKNEILLTDCYIMELANE